MQFRTQLSFKNMACLIHIALCGCLMHVQSLVLPSLKAGDDSYSGNDCAGAYIFPTCDMKNSWVPIYFLLETFNLRN